MVKKKKRKKNKKTMRQNEKTINESDMYYIKDSYSTIFNWNGFVDIQIRYNLFKGQSVDIFMNEKLINYSAARNESIENANLQIKLDYSNLLSSISRDQIAWENLPINPTVTNYAIELIDDTNNNRYVITQADTDKPFEFYPL